MRFKLLILPIFIWIIFCNCKIPKIKINLSEDYSGWGYVVGSTKVKNIKSNYFELYLDSSGIIYVDSSTINGSFSEEFYRNNLKLTGKEVKFLSTIDEPNIKRRIFIFYILSKSELQYEEDYWTQDDVRRKFRREMVLNLNKHINENKLKAE